MEGVYTHSDLFPDIFLLSEDNFSVDEDYFFSKYQLQEQHEINNEIPEFGLLNEDSARFNAASPPLETCLEEIENAKLCKENVSIPTPEFDHPKKENKFSDEFASLKLLSNHQSGLTRLRNEQATKPSETHGKRLSTDEVLRIAGARFVQSSSPATTHPYACSFSGFSSNEAREIALAELLLACAEKVGCQQHERARKLLGLCERSCSDTGNALERMSYYFCAALKERVDKETGRISPLPPFDLDKAMMSMSATKHAMHESVPFSQLALFPGMQAIIERVDDAKRVHVIDLGIRSGMQWTVLMQALVSRNGSSPIERLRITAIGTSQKNLIEETGKRLTSFAGSLNIPFSFKAVMVSDMADLNEGLFEPDPDETVAIYTSHVLRSMLWKPDQLESLMKVVVSGLNPRVVVVTEIEASHNSPAFVTRFIEALFFFGAFFDCLETFMKGDEENRMICESLYFGHGIRDMVTNEGTDRKTRHVSVDVWRAFFARFGLEDVELSTSSMYQAKLILDKFCCEESCSIEKNGECAIFRWKGTPIQSLSVFAPKLRSEGFSHH